VQRDGLWYRIHRTAYGPVYYGKHCVYRFDDPDRVFGVLYMASRDYGAFVETLGRLDGDRRYPLLRDDLASRSLAVLEAITPLVLVDVTGKGLARAGADSRLLSTLDYQIPQAWSQAIHEHPSRPDGILYRARNDQSALCVALYERAAEKILIQGDSSPLYHPTNRVIRGRIARWKQRYGFRFVEFPP
jgi:hypothetical protein